MTSAIEEKKNECHALSGKKIGDAVCVDRTHDLQIEFLKFNFSLTLSQLS